MRILIALSVALALSIAGNAVLGWKLAKAGEKCRAGMVEAARIAIERERERAGKADRQAGQIAQETGTETRKSAAVAQEKTHARDQAVSDVRVTGECRMPAGLPSLQPAIDEANAAAGD